MTFKEKVLWASLATTIGVWGWYFAGFVAALAAPHFDPGAATGRFLGAVFLLVVIQVVAITAISIWTPKEAGAPADDRDREFARRAYVPAFVTLSALVATLTVVAPMTIMTAPAWLGDRPAITVAIVISNALLLSLVLAELVRSGTQILLYRRGG